jgi:hypothetical protein
MGGTGTGSSVFGSTTINASIPPGSSLLHPSRGKAGSCTTSTRSSFPSEGQSGILHHLDEILISLGEIHPWEKARFLLAPQPLFGGRTPLDDIRQATRSRRNDGSSRFCARTRAGSHMGSLCSMWSTNSADTDRGGSVAGDRRPDGPVAPVSSSPRQSGRKSRPSYPRSNGCRPHRPADRNRHMVLRTLLLPSRSNGSILPNSGKPGRRHGPLLKPAWRWSGEKGTSCSVQRV